MNSNDFEWVLEITWKHKLHQCLGMSLKLVTLTQADGNVRAGWHHWTRDGENTLFMAVVGFLQSSGGFFWMWRFLINSAQLVLGWPTVTSDCGDLGAIPSSYISSPPLSSVSLQELHTQPLPCSVPIPGLSAFAIGPHLQCVHSH